MTRTGEDTATIRPLGRPGDLGWVVMAHGQQYAAEFGWDVTFEALVARVVADFSEGNDRARRQGWIAEVAGQRAGCVLCTDKTPAVAQLRLLLVAPAARGRGLGAQLVATCIDFARAAGYERLCLWTNHPLVAARQVYLRAGFTLIEEEPHHSFGVDLIGQTYSLNLRGPEAQPA